MAIKTPNPRKPISKPHPKSKPKTAKARLARDQQLKKVVVEKDFAGIKAGSTMLVATPKIIDNYIRNIPKGTVRTIPAMRDDLALRYDCDVTCPVSTALFIRIVCEAAIEDIDNGKAQNNIAPFWRLLTSKDKITARLDLIGGKTWVDEMRAGEVAG